MRWKEAIGLLLCCLAGLLTACSVNPVTGDKELVLVSEDWELAVGRQQYAPLRQAQGGDYVVDPAVEAYVRRVGERLASRSDRKLPYEFNVINDSTPNAWALPGGKIAINRGLLTALGSESELAAVLGHEIVHAAARHGAQGQTRGLALQTLVLTATVAGAREGYGQLAQLGSTIGATIINSRYGREAELESDRYGMEYMSRAGYNPQGAVDLQKTFVKLSQGRRSDWLSGLFASHPPSQARVRANQVTAARLGQSGEVGRERYQQAMRGLMRSRDAYAAFDKAQAAHAKGDRQQALTLIRQAIRAEPREGHFHSFVGDLAREQKDYGAAKQAYDRAISLNDEFFYYFLQRAKVHEATRNTRAAAADYDRSLRLMPTADAQAALGRYAEAAGRRDQARRLYQRAAQTRGPAGQQARAALARLDPPSVASSTSGRQGAVTAGRVLVKKGTTKRGTLGFVVTNTTRRSLGSVTLGIRTSPRAPWQEQVVRGPIAPGRRRLLDTRQQISTADLRRLEVRVLRASPAR